MHIKKCLVILNRLLKNKTILICIIFPTRLKFRSRISGKNLSSASYSEIWQLSNCSELWLQRTRWYPSPWNVFWWFWWWLAILWLFSQHNNHHLFYDKLFIRIVLRCGFICNRFEGIHDCVDTLSTEPVSKILLRHRASQAYSCLVSSILK